MKIHKTIWREDFKYEVSLPCPHNGEEVRSWLNKNSIPFIYFTYNAGRSIEYIMTEEEHATWFKLRWS
jgi:hypothetical protein